MVQSAKPNGYARGKHPNSLAVLAANRRPPRRTGAAANPNGRPPAGESFNDALRYFLELPPAYLLAGLLGEWQLPPERNNMRHVLAMAQVLESVWQQQARIFTMNKASTGPAITLPAAIAAMAGILILIGNKNATGTVIVTAGFGGVGAGGDTVTLAQGDGYLFFCDGAYWYAIGHTTPA